MSRRSSRADGPARATWGRPSRGAPPASGSPTEAAQPPPGPRPAPARSSVVLLRDVSGEPGGAEPRAVPPRGNFPPYFSQAVISSDRRTANLAFGIRLQGLDKQKGIVDDIRKTLHPPPGVSAEVA